MAKFQTRRSISLSRDTYERLRSYCEANGMSMSQFVEGRIGDFLGRSSAKVTAVAAPAAAKTVVAPKAARTGKIEVVERDRGAGNIFTF